MAGKRAGGRAADLRRAGGFWDADQRGLTGFFLYSRWRGGSRLQFWVGALLVVSFGLLLFWSLFPTDDGTLSAIRQRGTVRVGLDASFPPFEAVDGAGQIVGLDVDLARAIAADLGVEVEIVNIGFDGLYDALLARRVDLVISGLPYDPRWTEDVAYTRNYFNAGQVLVTRRDDLTLQHVEDLSDQTLAIEWGSQAEMEARRLRQTRPQLDLVRQATAAEAIEALLTGQTEAAVVDGVSAVGALPRGLRIVTYLTDEWYAAAVHIESQDLLAAVNDSLVRLEERGELAKMQAKWLQGAN
ncbi:MAG TPA: transporter substrate-binding domain-containing protein [Anaerolineae bacterium]|nr:transporter substrate-binding domain-containing protein [Anaerolineae bacterium]